MENFKKEHFSADHPDQPFPAIHAVGDADAQALRRTWCERLRVEPEYDPLALLRLIEARAEPISGSAEAEGFNLARTLEETGVRPQETVYVNWCRFDTVDVIRLDELSEFFDYIWYPSADDIEVFDSGCAWILLVRHDGALSILRLPGCPTLWS